MAIHFVHIAIQIHEELEKWQTIVFCTLQGYTKYPLPKIFTTSGG